MCVCVCVQVGEVRSLIEGISRQAEEVARRQGAVLSAPQRDQSKHRAPSAQANHSEVSERQKEKGKKNQPFTAASHRSIPTQL